MDADPLTQIVFHSFFYVWNFILSVIWQLMQKDTQMGVAQLSGHEQQHKQRVKLYIYGFCFFFFLSSSYRE